MSASASDSDASKVVSSEGTSSPINGHPPKARLAFRVGITGHRPERLPPAAVTGLAEPVRFVLETVANVVGEVPKTHPGLYAPESPVLRVISSLAEGADRIVAEEGLRLGWQLECPLPLPIDEYEKDFEGEESKRAFRGLLGRAAATLELDGSRSHAAEAYAAAGRMVLAQCDVLIAIWDGEEPRGRGGTAETIEAALADHIPVVWIKAHAPHDCCLMRASRGGAAGSWWEAGDLGDLTERIRRLLLAPQPEHHRGDLRESYFAERQPGWSVAVWGTFRSLLTELRMRNLVIPVRDFESSTATEWASESTEVPDELEVPRETARAWETEWAQAPDFALATKEYLARGFLKHSAWADRLAEHYANLHRSAFVLNYLFGVLAVALAVLAFCCWQYPWASKGLVLAELATLIVIVAWWARSRQRQWHDRWIDYRLLAELLRVQRFLAPLGGTAPLARPGPHQSYGDPRDTWVYWHFKAVVRATGMPSAKVDGAYLRAYRRFVWKRLVIDQWNYHQESARRRLAPLLRSIHVLSFVLLLAVLAACLVHLASGGEVEPPGLKEAVTLVIAAVCPALAAALHAISVQAELERLIKRSQAMSNQFAQVASALGEPDACDSSRSVARIIEPLASGMILENLDWRLVFEAREYLPG
jgi:hypothetical protein